MASLRSDEVFYSGWLLHSGYDDESRETGFVTNARLGDEVVQVPGSRCALITSRPAISALASAAWKRHQRSDGPVLTTRRGARRPISGHVSSRPAGARLPQDLEGQMRGVLTRQPPTNTEPAPKTVQGLIGFCGARATLSLPPASDDGRSGDAPRFDGRCNPW